MRIEKNFHFTVLFCSWSRKCGGTLSSTTTLAP